MQRYSYNLPLPVLNTGAYGEKNTANYCKAVITLDTETTTYFSVGGEWLTEAQTTEQQRKDSKDYIGIVYIWQIRINDFSVYGRTRDELIDFFARFDKLNPARKVIYVHNLNYDYSFLSDILPVNDKENNGLIARAKMQPLKISVKGYNIELRDSYALSNMSLSAIAKAYNYGDKLTGELDYTKAHLPNTPLSEQELKYCERDIDILHNYILNQWYIPYDGDFTKIPLTQTGVARKAIKSILFNDKKYIKHQKTISPKTISEYKLLHDAFSGGVAHANYLYSSPDLNIVENVWSYDRASSYPTEMVTRKFPCGKFVKMDNPEKNLDIWDENKVEIATIRYHNLRASGAWGYISFSKCKEIGGERVDNGRIICADFCTLTITNIDMQIINALYDYSNAEILECYVSPTAYLHRDYILKILELYGNKTKLKKSDPALYMHSKQILNSLYGMMVTDIVKEDIYFDNKSGDWSTEYESKPESEIAELMTEKLNKTRPFINYSAGVFVTAFARQQLFAPLMSIDPKTGIADGIGDDVIYTDTDSLKIVNNDKNKHYIDDYNIKMLERLHKASVDLKIPYDKFAPKDPDGVSHPLGVFECEGKYDKFATMGAKKYVYQKGGSFGFTVAGLQKTYVNQNGVTKTMTEMGQFVSGSQINNGRTNYSYNTQQYRAELTDYLGNRYINDYERGVAMWRTTYTFSISKDYAILLSEIADRIGEFETHMYNKLTDPLGIYKERIGI